MIRVHLNSKEDYLYYQKKNKDNPEVFLKEYKILLENAMGWFVVGELPSKEAGVVDATHRVDEQPYPNPDDPEGEPLVKYVQLEKRDNELAKLFRIGFTKEEVQRIIDENTPKKA